MGIITYSDLVNVYGKDKASDILATVENVAGLGEAERGGDGEDERLRRAMEAIESTDFATRGE